MKKAILMIGLTFFILYTCLASTEQFSVRIPNPPKRLAEQFERSGYDIASHYPGQYLDIVVTQMEYDMIKSLYPEAFKYQRTADLQSNIQSMDRAIPGYTSYDDFLVLLSNLQLQYPDLLRVQTIGESTGKQYYQQGYAQYENFQHDIISIMLSDNAAIDEDEPAFYFIGALHAREPISTQVCLAILTHFLENYGTDPRITEIVNSSEIWFVPIINPDGHKIVLDQTNVWWRKNIRDNNENQTIDLANYGSGADGVDLNRNFGHEWNYIGASGDENYATYHGPYPNSEPETTTITDFWASRNFLAGISYHSYGELVLFPMGYISNLYTADYAEQSSLAIQMAESIPSIGGTHYAPYPSWGLYPASGTSDDYAYAVHGIFAYTIELATSFIPSAAEVNVITQNNLEAAKLLIERKNRATLTGNITDIISGEPIEATVFISIMDNHPLNRSLYKSNAGFGRYHRFLPVGVYDVLFYADGYQPEEMTVEIIADTASVLDIQMSPTIPIDLNIFVYDEAFDPVSDAEIFFPETSIPSQMTDEFGYTSFSGLSQGAYKTQISKPGYETYIGIVNYQNPNNMFTLMSSPLIFDGFEEGLSNWTTTHSWGVSTNNEFSGQYSLSDSPSGNYASNRTSYATYAIPIELVGINNASLKFQLKRNILLDGDHLALQFSTDQLNWQTLDYYNGTCDWEPQTYSLNHFLGQTIWLRFMMVSNSSGVADGVFIDDFSIFINYVPVVQNTPSAKPFDFSIYPNPFSLDLNILIRDCDQKARYDIDIFNLRGQHVSSIIKDNQLTKSQLLNWNSNDTEGKKLANGIYFIRMRSGSKTLGIKKILYIK